MNDKQARESKYKGFRCAPPTRRNAKHKNTRDFCKGNPKHPHVKQWKPYAEVKGISYPWQKAEEILVCVNCRKEFETHWPKDRSQWKCHCSRCNPNLNKCVTEAK